MAQKTGIPKWNPGKWKHGPKPAVCPCLLILSHTSMGGYGDGGGYEGEGGGYGAMTSEIF